MSVIFTIGYEGADVEALIATLAEAGVSHVADVRDVPISRKRGFSKRVLAENLENAGITYSHFKALGDPKEGRDAMRRGDKETFFEVFSARLASKDAQDALIELKQRAMDHPTVLLCYERNPKDCHRTIIASELTGSGALELVRHLGVRNF